VEDWLPLVASARRAESLNFSFEPRVKLSQSALVAKFEPEGDLETAVRDILTHARAHHDKAVSRRAFTRSFP
jgi:U3 small nucleolar RNA-associated protein 14